VNRTVAIIRAVWRPGIRNGEIFSARREEGYNPAPFPEWLKKQA